MCVHRDGARAVVRSGRQGRGAGGAGARADAGELRAAAGGRARARPAAARRDHQLGLPVPRRHGHGALRTAVPGGLHLLPQQAPTHRYLLYICL